MNKKSLIRKINSRVSFDRETSTKVFNRVFELIKNSIIDDKSFEIEEFGEFNVEHRKMKTMIDFKVKTEVLLPPKDKLVFVPAYSMENRLNTEK